MNLDYSLSHNAFDRCRNLSHCESLQCHILIHASSDSGDLPAMSRINILVACLFYVILKQTSHALES